MNLRKVIFVISIVLLLGFLVFGYFSISKDKEQTLTLGKQLSLPEEYSLISDNLIISKSENGYLIDLRNENLKLVNSEQLDGHDSKYYLNISNFGEGILNTKLYSAYDDLVEEGYIIDGKLLPTLYETQVPTDLENWAGSSKIKTLGNITQGEWQGNPISSEYIEDNTILLKDLAQNGCKDGQILKWQDSLNSWICSDNQTNICGIIDWSDIQNRPSGLDDGDDETSLNETQIEDFITDESINLANGSQIENENIASQDWVLNQGFATSFLETDPTLDTWVGSSFLTTVGTITSGTWNGNTITSEYIENSTIALEDIGQNGCNNDQILKWNDTASSWICGDDRDTVTNTLSWTSITDRPSGLDDGDDNTVLSESEVEGYITNESINLQEGSQVNSELIASQNWVNSQGFLSACVETDPTLVDWQGSSNISTVGTITSGTWNADITDGIIELEDLDQNGCTDGQIIKWNDGSTSWGCADDATGGSNSSAVYEKWDPDAPPGSPSIYDDEFNDGILNPLWTIRGAGGIVENNKYLQFTTGDPYIYKNIPSGNFTIWTKVSISGNPQLVSHSQAIFAVQAGEGQIIDIGLTTLSDNSMRIDINRYSNWASWSSNPIMYNTININDYYFSIRRTGSSLEFWVSTDGFSYNRIYTTSDPGVDRMGLIKFGTSSAFFDYFRYDSSYHGWDWVPPGRVIPQGGGGTLAIGSPITNSTQGSLFFAGAGESLSQDGTNLYWNDVLNRLGIGINTPNHTLDINGNLGLSTSGYINWGSTDGATGYGIRDNAGKIEYKDSNGSWNNIGGLKAWYRSYGTTDVSKNTNTWEDMPDMTINLTSQASTVDITFSAGVGNSSSGGITSFRLLIDGVIVGTQTKVRVPSLTVGSNANLIWIENLSAGAHTIKVQWNSEVGTSYNRATGGTEHRTIIVKEY